MQLTDELEELTRLVAMRTGKTPDAVLKEALEARARAAGVDPPGAPRPKPIDEAKIRALIARTAALPIIDPRTPDAILGYDEVGVPR
jgi:antitoxin VapB